MARGKSNIGPDDGGFEYLIEQVEPLPGIQASRIAWGKAVEGSARELLTDPADTSEGLDAGDTNAKDSAEEFLIEVLKDGATPSKLVEAEAKQAGIAWRTLRRASDCLGVKKKKSGVAWYWELPQNFNLSAQVGHIVQRSNVGQVGQVELDTLDEVNADSEVL